MSKLQVAEQYTGQGWRCIPIPEGSKAPQLNGWPKLRIERDELPSYFSNGSNIGVLLGKPSGGLVDIDLDRPEATLLAAEFLPATGAVFGRQSKPRSHYLFRAQGLETRKFNLPKGWTPGDGQTTVVEIRSTGAQTVFPGSVHPSGEEITWACNGEPVPVSEKDLVGAVEGLHQAALQVFVINSALSKVEADDYDVWIKIGMALHNWQVQCGFKSDVGLGIWDEWSRSSVKYNLSEMDGKWRSFANPPQEDGNRITLGTLFHFAFENGWEKLPDQDRHVQFSGNGSAVDGRLGPVADDDQYSELIEQHGQPYFVRTYKNGKTDFRTINESFWAGLYALEHHILYEPDEKAFYQYDPCGIYKPISNDVIKSSISERLLQMSRDWKVAELEQCRQDVRLNAIVGHLRGLVEQRDAFKRGDAKFIHLKNGVLVLTENGFQLEAFSPDYFARNQSPIDYDPEAACPRFLGELLGPAVKEDDVILLQKMFGLCLFGENIVQRFFIIDGTPGGGKSQLATVLRGIVGEENVAELRTDHLHQRFELFRLLKKSLIVGADVEAKFLMSKGANKLKALVGGDRLDAEMKGGHGDFPIHGNFNVVITSNSRLRVDFQGDVGAWRRRITIIRYEAPPPEQKISDFGKLLLKEEGPGILNWALQGIRLLLQDVEDAGDIHLSDRQIHLIDALMAESDSLRHFLEEQVISDPHGDLTGDEIVEAYAQYCPDKGWNALPITVLQKQLPELMLELFQTTKAGSIQRDGRNQRGFRKVAFSIMEDNSDI